MKRTRKGFTLVELLVVIAILAILSTVAVVGYTSYIKNAEEQAAKTEAAHIDDAIVIALVSDNPVHIQLSNGYAILTRNGNSYTVASSATASGKAIENIPEDLVARLQVVDTTLVYTSNKGVSVDVVSGELFGGTVPTPTPTPDPEQPGEQPGEDPTEPEHPTTPVWELVTDVSELVAGKQIVIVAAEGKNYAISTAQRDNNRGAVAVEVVDGKLKINDDVQIVTLEKDGDNYAFNVGNGYLYAASSDKNYLKTQPTNNDNGKWTIEIGEDGVATIKAQGSNTRNWLRFNATNNPVIFSCYASGQKDVCIYINNGAPANVNSSEDASHTEHKDSDGNFLCDEENCTVIVEPTNTTLSIEKANALGVLYTDNSVNSTGEYKVTGVIELINGDIIVIKDNNSNTLQVFKSDYDSQTNKPVVGDTITVEGIIGSYNGVAQIKHSEIIEHIPNATTKVDKWVLVTDVSNLAVGDHIVIVASDYNVALSTTQNNNNRGQATVTKNDDKTVTFGNSVQEITLEAGTTSGTFAFNTGSGYLHAASSGSNYLRTQTANDANSSWKITIDANGVATIVAQGSYTRNVMQYNQASSLFACYASASQKSVSIYKLVTE